MDTKIAERIVSDYQEAIAKGPIGETVLRKASWLPYPKGMIKYAIYLLLDGLVKGNGLSDTEKECFVNDYSILEYFVSDDLADKYVKNYTEWQVKKSNPFKTKKDESLIKQYLAFSALLRGKSDELHNELIQFIVGLG